MNEPNRTQAARRRAAADIIAREWLAGCEVARDDSGLIAVYEGFAGCSYLDGAELADEVLSVWGPDMPGCPGKFELARAFERLAGSSPA